MELMYRKTGREIRREPEMSALANDKVTQLHHIPKDLAKSSGQAAL
jgi:hypothetical protein